MATFQEFYSSLDSDVSVRGKQFEKFCKWYLENDPYWKNEVDVVWLWEDYPDRWANKDLGIDLVFRDKDKNIWAVQAKCYDPDYYIKYEDMATFIAESNRPQIHKRLLISSTDNLGKNAVSVLVGQDNKPVIRVMLSDFVKSSLIFPDHPNELKKAKLLPKPEPVGKYDYQLEPINAVAEAFKANNRGQLIMACGTGKTFTTLWIKEKLKSESTLILLPSLSLLSQTLTEWNFAMNQDFRSLAVCSDETVTKGAKEDDRTLESVSELPFPVTAAPLEIASFLKSKGPKVIFSTYQSSEMIADAMGDKSVPEFDLVIADEAHRCTGNMDSSFATVLDDSKIRTKKKLFTTATPRTYSSNLKQAAEERDIKITGMDDEHIYGPVFYRLSFGDAIKRGLLTDYQLVIIGVDDGMIAEYINKRELIASGEEKVTDAKSLAAMIGLLKAIKDYDLKRVISFHSRVSKARDFSEEIRETSNLIPKSDLPTGVLATDYVSGQMPTGQRRQKLQQLKELTQGDRMILSNARCLSEGVDVPALDGVAIIDPRQSTVDIVQTVGRAIRLSKDKKVGTIVMPVFLETGEDAESVIEASNFKPVWDVVNALKSHDDRLSFELDAYRTSLGKDKKSSTHVTGLTKILIDLPAKYNREFADSLKTILIESVTASWYFWLGLLEQYKDEFGNTAVPQDYKTEDGYSLGSWVNSQRRTKTFIDGEKIQRLNELGFIWNMLDHQWQEGLNHLTTYKKNYGHMSIPKNLKDVDGFPLGFWVHRQIMFYKTNRLSAMQIDCLNEIGFDFTGRFDKLWEDFLIHLKNFEDEFGHIKITKSYISPDGYKLGSICNAYRVRFKNPKASPIPKERIEVLEKMGFIWTPDVYENKWNRNFDKAKQFKQTFGHLNVAQGYVTSDNFSLGSWLTLQKSLNTQGKLNNERKSKLESLGFKFENYTNTKKSEDAFITGIKNLKAYIKQYGNALVPRGFKSDDGYSLDFFVNRIRNHKEKLSSEELNQLNELDFVWNVLQYNWENGYMHLIEYKNSFNNIDVKQNYKSPDGYSLGRWVRAQKNTPPERMDPNNLCKLEKIGFQW